MDVKIVVRRLKQAFALVSRFARRYILTRLQQKPDCWLCPLALRTAKALLVTRRSSIYLRRIVDFSCPTNPLKLSQNLPEIRVLIVAAKKDFGLLPLVVSSVVQHCLNPINNVVVIVPEAQMRLLPRLPKGTKILGESSVLPNCVYSAIDSHHPENRRGWILQQALKLWAARKSAALGVLVLDADTVLTKPRVFLNGEGQQLLSYSHEYHTPYETHASHIWGKRRGDIGLSYVCHHQLMQPDVLTEMFPDEEALVNWILAADKTEHSPISDYHSYGRFIADNYPSRVALARWGNQSVPIKRDGSTEERQAFGHLRNSPEDAYSISFHHYLQEDGRFS